MKKTPKPDFIGMQMAHIKNGISIHFPDKWPKNQRADLLIPNKKCAHHPDAYLVFEGNLPERIERETTSAELTCLPHGTPNRFISFVEQLRSGNCSEFWWVGGAPSMYFELWSEERWSVLHAPSDLTLEELKL